MGWVDGRWVEGATCEDAPCCGCCGPQGDGDYYGYNEPPEYDDYYDGMRDDMAAVAAENGGHL